MASSIVNNDITNIPLFGSLKTLLQDRHPYNKTIFTVINNQEKLHKVVGAIQNLLRMKESPMDALCLLYLLVKPSAKVKPNINNHYEIAGVKNITLLYI